MKKDYVITFLTEFIILASGLIVYKLAASIFGEEGFSEYALSRRTVSFIHPGLLLGLGVGIPRYIAFTAASKDTDKSDAYFLTGASILFTAVAIFALLANVFKEKLTFLMFGSLNYVYFVFPISVMLVGLTMIAACYSYFRGKLSMLKANLLQVVNAGIIPPLALGVSRSIAEALLITGMLWIVVSAGFFLSIAREISRKGRLHVSYGKGKELIYYGLQRLPADFGMAALLTLPVTFTAHLSGVIEAGYVAFSISLLSMVGSIFSPIGLILLPKASAIVASKDFQRLNNYITSLIKITLGVTVVGLVIFEIFADKIIALYLGENLSGLVLTARLIMISSLSYTVYVSIRSIIDAYYVRAVNTINVIISLMLFVVLSGLSTPSTGQLNPILGCFIVSVFVLGILTLFHARKIVIGEEIKDGGFSG